MKPPRKFSPEFKVQVVLEVLSGMKTQGEVCREHQIQKHCFTDWKRAFLERAPTLFETDDHRSEAEAKIAELERIVGRQAVEIAALKKASSILNSARRRSERW